MKADALKHELVESLADFAAGQWAQLGVSFPRPESTEQRATDPEALLLFTLHLGRHEARLFDETLDWLAINEPLVSINRLRGLCSEPVDRSLVDASLSWVAAQRGRATRREDHGVTSEGLASLFSGRGSSPTQPDPFFSSYGWSRPILSRSGKSQLIPIRAPIAFAFRLRRLLGVGVRAEIVRVLLTTRADRLSSKVIAASAGFAQRNVREGLNQLHEAGVIEVVGVADDRHYAIRHADWSALLGFDDAPNLPFHYDWIPVLRGLTRILDWLDRPGLDDFSDYMRASQARTLLDSIDGDLRYAGIPANLHQSVGAGQWDDLVNVSRMAVRQLIAGH